MEEKTLKERLLPASLIIKNFVRNEKECNYEKYMLQFVNESEYFLNKSNGMRYVSPENETFGQCDCITNSYQMDFKLIASKTELQGASILSMQKRIKSGVLVTSVPKEKERGMDVTRIHAALRNYNFEMLCKLRGNATKKQGVENDVCELLKTLETKKNLLLFFSYKFSFQGDYKFNEGVLQIQKAISSCFQVVMQYRHNVADGFDTYIAFVYDEHIVFVEEIDNYFSYIDSVKLSKSPIYLKLLSYEEIL